MPSRNRDTLKAFFSEGSMPSAEMFADLIDSMLNMDDEGFRKSDENGFEISNIGDSESLISFYKESHPDKPVWRFRFDGQENNLIVEKVTFSNKRAIEKDELEKAKYLLSLSAENDRVKVGIGIAQPQDTLQVVGNIRAEGRRGIVDQTHDTPKADNDWHTIAGPFVGCQCLEVVARAKNDQKKRYAMIHAIAMHSIGPTKKNIFSLLGLKNRIRSTHSFYNSFKDRLKLQWKPGDKRGEYVLQIRTNCDYGEDSQLTFHITNLWSDQNSEVPTAGRSGIKNL